MPIAITGDMMKVFKHQQVPGIDDIYFPGRTLVSYKIVTSAAFNYDWPECIAETFAAYRPQPMTPTIALRTILDQAAMGINMQMDARPRDIDPSSDKLRLMSVSEVVRVRLAVRLMAAALSVARGCGPASHACHVRRPRGIDRSSAIRSAVLVAAWAMPNA